MKRWRAEKMKEGYGKALYARRAQRFRNEETLRAAVSDAIVLLHEAPMDPVVDKVIMLLVAAQKAAAPVTAPIDYMP